MSENALINEISKKPTKELLDATLGIEKKLSIIKEARLRVLEHLERNSSAFVKLSMAELGAAKGAVDDASKQLQTTHNVSKQLQSAYRKQITAERSLERATEEVTKAKEELLVAFRESLTFIEGDKAVSERLENIEQKARGIGRHKHHY